MKVCRVAAADGGCRVLMLPRPSAQLFVAIDQRCRSHRWGRPFVRFHPNNGAAEILLDGPTPRELADVLRAEPAFDYAVTVG